MSAPDCNDPESKLRLKLPDDRTFRRRIVWVFTAWRAMLMVGGGLLLVALIFGWLLDRDHVTSDHFIFARIGLGIFAAVVGLGFLVRRLGR